MKNWYQEFKDFLIKGDLITIAIGLAVGAAFLAVIASITTNLITPLVGMVTGGDLADYSFTINGSTFGYGAVINAIITFAATGAILFLILKGYTKAKALANKNEAETAGPTETELLTEIRDLLKTQAR
jgi:large conductance mechanosensitive channel